MSKEYSFIIFCVEQYKLKNNISGKEAFNIFEKYKVNDYLYQNFDVLHTLGSEYLTQDISEYISLRKKAT